MLKLRGFFRGVIRQDRSINAAVAAAVDVGGEIIQEGWLLGGGLY